MDKRKVAASSITVLLLVAGSLIVANTLAYRFNLGRLDVTHNAAFTLSEGSKRVVADLEDQMEITAYFSSDLPAQFADTERQVRDLLLEYEAAAGGNLQVRVLDPSGDDDIAEQAEEDGVQRVAHQTLDRDRVSVVEGYRGLVIKYLGETKAMPVIQDSMGLEYDITMAIKELTGDTRKVGILGGHEGPTLTEGLTGLNAVMPTYEFVEVDANSAIDQELAALLIVSPETTISEAELRNINTYIMNGGSLGVFGGGIKLNLEGQEPTSDTVDSGLNALLEGYGVTMSQDVVFDGQCSRAPMRGPMGLQVAVPYPPVPIVSFDEEAQAHPVLFRVPSSTIPFTSTLNVGAAPGDVSVSVLASSSENSWRDTSANVNLRPRNPREWAPTQDSGPFPIMVAIEGQLPSAFAAAEGDANAVAQASSEVRVLVVGTGAFLRDEFLPPPGPNGERQVAGPFELALNAVDWLAAESDLLAIRAKDNEPPPIETPPMEIDQARDQVMTAAEEGNEAGAQAALEEHQRLVEEWEEGKASRAQWHKLGNTFFLPLLFILFGVLRWRLRKQARATMKL